MGVKMTTTTEKVAMMSTRTTQGTFFVTVTGKRLPFAVIFFFLPLAVKATLSLRPS